MNALATIGADLSTTALLAMVPEQVAEIYAWADDLAPIAEIRSGIGAALAQVAAQRGVPAKTVRKKYDAFRAHGLAGLINRRSAPQLWETEKEIGLSEGDQELVKQWCEVYQRKCETALRGLLRAWREQRIGEEQQQRGLAVPETATPLNPLTGYPRGWSLRNLMRYAPSEYELKAARIGRTAAAAHRPLVYTTRAHLYPGQYFLFDDMWHDHEVVDLDQRRRGRPLEFHALDLSSACKIAWGNRTRVLRADGTHEGLKGGDFRFLLASIFSHTGYHRDGTTCVVELGTAAVPETIQRLLYDATGGLIRFNTGGMTGAAAHAGQYPGRGKGNFKFKAALESAGNLIHNEMAYLAGQTGMDRQHAPEEQHGRQRHTDALLCAFSQLPAGSLDCLQWDYCTIVQFRRLCEQVYAQINGRTEHDLEGWDERWVPSTNGRMRRMSPREVWLPGRRALVPLDVATTALLVGHELGKERTTRSGMIELHDGELSGDVLRFDATALPDREKFLTVLNPFDAGRLFCFDARGAFVAALERINKPCRSDVEAVQREMGRAAKQEAALLAPLRQRHLAEAREKTARHTHNAGVLSEAAAERDRADFGTVARAAQQRPARAPIAPDLLDDFASPAPAAPIAPADREETPDSIFDL